jgi:FkbM family methyltransferase
MISGVRRVARHIRHLPGLKNWDGLWDTVRGPYQRFLNAGGGVDIVVSNTVTIRIPAEFAGGEWDAYEPASIRLAADWAREHRNGLFLDIGSAAGIFSTVVLFANPDTEVIAFDSDLASLAQTRRFCRHASGTLRLVYGFVADAGSQATLVEAVASTELELIRANPSGDVGTTRYVCIEDAGFADIPRNTLDDLFDDATLDERPILIKCDVEGAELLVLRGADGLHHRPDLLLSVHPPALPQHGHTPDDVRAFLERLQYRISVVAIDHEEHWWCRPKVA